MIARLLLRKYGKFRDAALALSPFTIMTGPNEAGKTTVFDALFDGLCRGNKNDAVFQRLKDRYGKDRASSPEWAEGSKPLKFDAHEFLDVFAVRGGGVHIDASGAGAWLKAFRNALFTGGLDPAELAGELREAAGEAKNKPLMKRLAALEAETAGLRADLDAERNRRTAVLAGEDALKRLAEVLVKLRGELEGREERLAELKPRYESARDGAELDRVRGELALLRELDAAEEKLAALAAYSAGALNNYDLLTAAHDRKKEEQALLRGQLSEKEKALEAARERLGKARAAVPPLRRQSAKASASRTAIDDYYSACRRAVKKTVNFPVRLSVWAAGLALAAGLYYWVKGTAGLVVGYVTALLAGAVGWFAAIKTIVGYEDPQETKDLLAWLADDWRNSGLDPEPVARGTLPGVQESLASVQASLKAAEETLERSEAAFAAAEKEKNELAIKAGMAEDARLEAEEAARKWLQKNACATRDEYHSKAEARANTEADRNSRREAAERTAKGLGCGGIKDLRFRLQDRAERLERGGARPGLPEEELRALENAYKDLCEETRTLKERLMREEADHLRQKEVAATKLEGVPEAINRLAVAIGTKEAEAAEIRLMLAGYRLAAGAFERIAADSASKVDALTAEVGGMLGRLLPGRAVMFPAFAVEGAAVADAGGSPRAVEQLSAGTRDLFMLAARLALARRSRTGADGKLSPAMLVLDEPFYTLDPERARTALELLWAFHGETGWQVIILTKDPGVAEAAKSIEGLRMTEVEL